MQQTATTSHVHLTDGRNLTDDGISMRTGAFTAFRDRRFSAGTAEPPLVALFKRLLNPMVAVLTLMICMIWHSQPLGSGYLALCVLIFLTTSQIMSPAVCTLRDSPAVAIRKMLPRLVLEWLGVVGVLLFVGFALKTTDYFSRRVMFTWIFMTPVTLVLATLVNRRILRLMGKAEVPGQKHIVIGANHLGMELNRRAENVCHSDFLGFFDDRDADRLPRECRNKVLGKTSEVVEYVHRNSVAAVYIALPVSAAPRMVSLLNDLRDTAASVYFVPDLFSFDVIQARYMEIDGLPVVSIYDSPFNGTSAIAKRITDLVFAGAAFLFLWPFMALIALGVKLSSPGPVLFKQRRYGLNGEEILVYKFRSMTVCEDGKQVTQATKNDVRVTPFGRFLRKTSLDELPQILNVLEGKMSLVGPRPHAVAHNEQYRKLISGYMFRHKVRPGITGWAQVNGLRGETETIEKMRQRVEYDIDYMRKWSLWLDIKIVFKTLKLVVSDSQAY